MNKRWNYKNVAKHKADTEHYLILIMKEIGL